MEKNLRDVFDMMVSFFMMTSDIAKAYCSAPEYTAEELIENISFDLRSIAEYHFGEDNSMGVDDEEDAARAFIDVLSNVIEFMLNFIDPTMLLHCLHDNNTRVSKDLIKTFSHDGIDTIEAVESVARAYAVLGQCAHDVMKYDLNRTPLEYFDTDSIPHINDVKRKELLNAIFGKTSTATCREKILNNSCGYYADINKCTHKNCNIKTCVHNPDFGKDGE